MKKKIMDLFKKPSDLTDLQINEAGTIADKKGWLAFLGKNNKVKSLPSSMAPVNQESVFSSSQYDMGQEYRVMAWNSRLLGMAFGTSMLVNVGLSCVVFSLFPLKETKHSLVTFRDKSEQVSQIAPIDNTVKGLDVLMKLSCQDYVIDRETINHVNENERWSKRIRFLSSDEIWQDFWQRMNPEMSDSPLRDYQTRKATRSVLILVSSQLDDQIFQVDWEEIITIEGREVGRKRFRSTLKVEMTTNKIKDEHTRLNPIGFTVVKYQVSAIGEE